ncbi:hypothetical protein AB0F17_26920 [Nonomuraea sp. NPDC026600]|uniref:hypothetical protein n=1 Tax=Nonomuraea sp. NPDC026600 TaxID=3155363 RepID=UPI0033D798D5
MPVPVPGQMSMSCWVHVARVLPCLTSVRKQLAEANSSTSSLELFCSVDAERAAQLIVTTAGAGGRVPRIGVVFDDRAVAAVAVAPATAPTAGGRFARRMA